MQRMIDRLRMFFWPTPASWRRRDRFATPPVDTPLLRDLQGLAIKSQNRGANPRLPTTRPAEPHFGRRERVQDYGRE